MYIRIYMYMYSKGKPVYYGHWKPDVLISCVFLLEIKCVVLIRDNYYLYSCRYASTLHLHVHVHVHIYIRMYHLRTYVRTYVHVHVCMYMYMYILLGVSHNSVISSLL